LVKSGKIEAQEISQVATSTGTIQSSAKSAATVEKANPGRKFLHYMVEAILWILLIGMAIFEFAPISWIFATSLRNPADSFNLPPSFWPLPLNGKII